MRKEIVISFMSNNGKIDRKRMGSKKLFLAFTLSILLVACSGEDDGNTTDNNSDGDTTPPVVTAPANISVAASSVSGTPATDDTIAAFLAGASATDNIDGNVSVTNDAPATFSAATTTTVTFSARDVVGNEGTATATVTVDAYIDTTPPDVTAPTNISVAASSESGTPATDTIIAAFLAAASATDDIDGTVSVTNDAPANFPTATTTTVTFSASDTAGNIGTATATVTVGIYDNGTSWIGTKQLGVASAYTFGVSVTTDTDGNVYVAGYTTGDLDGNTLTGTRDFFVTKYDNVGARQYTRQLGVAGRLTSAGAVATDSDGNVYVAGTTQGDLDGNTLTGTSDFFVTKYDSTGVKQYTKQLGVAGRNTSGVSVATDSNGNVYVAGSTQGSLDGNTLTGTSDFFITKYDSTGVKQYTRQLGVASVYTYGNSVATDTNGNVYVTGSTSGGLDGNTLSGDVDFFVTKYDSSGAKQYTRQLGTAGHGAPAFSVATDVYGNVYVAGHTNGDLDSNTLSGRNDFFITKYDSIGNKQYTRQLGVAGAITYGFAVATDTGGNFYVAGFTYGGLDGNTLTGTTDCFVTKYDGTGTKQYTRQLGVAEVATSSYSVDTDVNGNVYVAGYTYGGLDGNVLSGNVDFFVTKYDSAGVKQ